MAQTLKVKIDGDASGFKSATEDAEGLLSKLGGKLKGVAGAVATAGAAVAGLGVALGAKLGFDSVQAASDLEQSVGGVEAVFGSAASKVLEFGKTAAQQFGMSANAVNQLTAPVGALLSGLGFTQDQAADTSVQLAKLGADLAAAFGGTAEEAVSALGSTLRGEFDPAEKFGVALSAAAVQAKALEMGLANAEGEVTSQGKAQATLALIMERTANVQGQAAREADTLAGRTARLSATMENLKARIGEQLMPVAVKLADIVSSDLLPLFERWAPVIAGKVGPALENLVGSFRAFGAAFAYGDGEITSSGLAGFFERLGYIARLGFNQAREAITMAIEAFQRFGPVIFGAVLPAAQAIVDNWDRIMSVASVLVPVLGSALAGYMAFTKVMAAVKAIQAFGVAVQAAGVALMANPIGLVVAGIAALAAGLYLAYQRWEGFRQVVDTVAAWLRDNVLPVVIQVAQWIGTHLVAAAQALGEWITGSLVPALAAFWDWLSAKIQPIVADLVSWFSDKVVPALQGIWDAINSSLIPALQGLWDFISANVLPVLQKVAEVVLPIVWEALQTFANQIMDTVIPAVVAIAKKVIEFGLELIQAGVKIAAFVITAVTKFAEFSVAVQQKISEAVGFVAGIAGRMLGAIGDLGGTLYNAGRALIEGLLSGIKDAVTETLSFVSGIAGKIAAVKGPLPYDRKVLIPNGMALMEGLASGIRQGMGQVEAMVGGIAPQMAVQLSPAAAAGRSGGGVTIEVHGNVYGPGGARWLAEELRAYEGSLR